MPWKSAAPGRVGGEQVASSHWRRSAPLARPAETGTPTIRLTWTMSVPAPRDGAADVGLELVTVADNDADRLAEHGAAEIVDRYLRRGHRALAGRRRGRAVHVGEHADLDDIYRKTAPTPRPTSRSPPRAASNRYSSSHWTHARSPSIRPASRCCAPGSGPAELVSLQLFGARRQCQGGEADLTCRGGIVAGQLGALRPRHQAQRRKPQATEARRISSLGDFDGMRFMCKVRIEKGGEGYKDRNAIGDVITPDRQAWQRTEQIPRQGTLPNAAVAAQANAAQAAQGKPSWAS